MDTNFKTELEDLKNAFEEALSAYLEQTHFEPKILDESIRYSLLLGGKRLRPVLMLACAQMLGGKAQDVLPLVIALEMIHTYSLIHDDLPAMDNDDFRRGQPSNHKKFGEGQAILAGDALLSQAFSICVEECKKGRTYINGVSEICKNAGPYGMVAGQAADLFYQDGENVGKSVADFIVLNKTAKMIQSAVVVPAYIYGVDENIRSILEQFAVNFGFLFQITDDILDVEGSFEKLGKTVGKDAKENKMSCVNLYGMDKARELAEAYKENCLKFLGELPFECSFFESLVQYVRSRES